MDSRDKAVCCCSGLTSVVTDTADSRDVLLPTPGLPATAAAAPIGCVLAAVAVPDGASIALAAPEPMRCSEKGPPPPTCASCSKLSVEQLSGSCPLPAATAAAAPPQPPPAAAVPLAMAANCAPLSRAWAAASAEGVLGAKGVLSSEPRLLLLPSGAPSMCAVVAWLLLPLNTKSAGLSVCTTG